MANFSTLTRRLFITLNIVILLLFLLACANLFLHPGKWWMIALLGLVFPFLLLAVFCFCVIGLVWPSYRRWSFISLVVLLIGWPNIHRFLAFHPGKGFSPEK